MKTITFSKNNRSDDRLHIETEGCIINIQVNLFNRHGQKVTYIEILSNKYKDDNWTIQGNHAISVTVKKED